MGLKKLMDIGYWKKI
jgi:hypothetical protein